MDELKKTRIGTDAVKLTSSKIITTAISFVSSMLLSRFRTLTEYGTYSQLLMAINLVCSLLMLGLPNCVNYFLSKADGEEERDKFLSVYYTISTLLSFTVGLVLVLSIPLLEEFFKNELIKYFWYFLAFYPWSKIIMASAENLLIVFNRTNTLLIYKVLNSVLLLGDIFFVQILNGNFMHYMISFLVTESLFTIWTYVIAKQNSTNFKISFNKKIIKTIFAFSIPIGFASMIGTINVELDKLIITMFFSTEDLAIFANASKELPVAIIATSLTAILMPQIVRLLQKDDKVEAVNIWNSATSISFAIISVLAMGFFVYAPEVITILYSEKYTPGISVFRVYCLVLLLRCTYFGMMLNATGNTKFILFSSIGTLVLNTCLNFILYYLFGFIGPAIATFMATLCMQLVQLGYTSKKTNIKFSKIFPWEDCAIYMFINIILGVIFYFIKNYICNVLNINSIIVAIFLGCVWALLFMMINFKKLKRRWIHLNKER